MREIINNMAKAILEFDLNDIDDELSHKQCVKANDMALMLWELVYNTKKSIEWELDARKDDNRYDSLDLVYDRIHKLLDEHNIIIDELVI